MVFIALGSGKSKTEGTGNLLSGKELLPTHMLFHNTFTEAGKELWGWFLKICFESNFYFMCRDILLAPPGCSTHIGQKRAT